MKSIHFCTIVAVALLGCKPKPPASCSESIATDQSHSNLEINRIKQFSAEGAFTFDAGKLKPIELDQIGTVLATRNLDKSAPSENLDADFIQGKIKEFQALPTTDKRMFFNYETTDLKELHVVQLSIEIRLNQSSTHREIYTLQKTGYFDSDGSLVCIMTKTPVDQKD
jgi:hypothetical protein